jgi:hypothetical protein
MNEAAGNEIPTFAQARKEAGLPDTVTAADLIDKAIIVMEWEPATAVVPDTGKVTEGFQVTSVIVDTGETVSWFCGQEVLVKALKAVRPGFRTVIRKPGRTYLFT